MILVKNIADIPTTGRPIVLAMGCFDGLHIGHQKVIQTAIDQAAAQNGEAWVYTFDPHPAKVLIPDRAPPLISAETCRRRKMEELGVHGIVSIPFDRDYAHISPDDFLSGLWAGIPNLSGIVCGEDWSFGYRAAGNFDLLQKRCGEQGIRATAVAPVLLDGERVSSTHIRKAISEGDIPAAEQLLGRPFCLFGTVIPGRKIGRELGFPTANIDPENELLPAPGVYAGWTRIQNSESVVPSAVFLGARQTFNDNEHVIESYLLDFDGDLYGQPIEVCLHRKVRGVETFQSKEALIDQIRKDVQDIRTILHADGKRAERID